LKVDFSVIYVEDCYLTEQERSRKNAILSKFPEAEIIPVENHWKIPALSQANPEDWVSNKKNVLVLGKLKTFKIQDNGRSTDFIAPSTANGCLSCCLYCVEQGTFITTPNGAIPVEEIQEGDAVVSYDTNSDSPVIGHVSALASREVDEIYEIQVGSRVLYVSAEHPIYTKHRGWVEARHLSFDDEVLCEDFSEE
jgi:hypothetical protein